MENDESRPLPAKEAEVLDADGNTLYRPSGGADVKFESGSGASGFKVAWGSTRGGGILPKILIGSAFIALLLLGLTVAGVALAVVFLGFIVRSIFRPRRQ